MSRSLNQEHGSNSRILIKAYANYEPCSINILNGLRCRSPNQIRDKMQWIIQLNNLTVTFCSIVRLAEHLAIFCRGSTTLAPRCDMVGIHFAQIPNFFFIGIMSKSTMWTV